MCVLLLLHMCPHTTTCVLILERHEQERDGSFGVRVERISPATSNFPQDPPVLPLGSCSINVSAVVVRKQDSREIYRLYAPHSAPPHTHTQSVTPPRYSWLFLSSVVWVTGGSILYHSDAFLLPPPHYCAFLLVAPV